MSPLEFIKSIYSELIFEKNWCINDVDKMDIFYYLEILAYRLNEAIKNNKDINTEEVYIDQCSWL